MPVKPKCKYCWDKKYFTVLRMYRCGRKEPKPVLERLPCPRCNKEEICQ